MQSSRLGGGGAPTIASSWAVSQAEAWGDRWRGWQERITMLKRSLPTQCPPALSGGCAPARPSGPAGHPRTEKCIYKPGLHPAEPALSFMALLHLIFHFLSLLHLPAHFPSFPGGLAQQHTVSPCSALPPQVPLSESTCVDSWPGCHALSPACLSSVWQP